VGGGRTMKNRRGAVEAVSIIPCLLLNCRYLSSLQALTTLTIMPKKQSLMGIFPVISIPFLCRVKNLGKGDCRPFTPKYWEDTNCKFKNYFAHSLADAASRDHAARFS